MPGYVGNLRAKRAGKLGIRPQNSGSVLFIKYSKFCHIREHSNDYRAFAKKGAIDSDQVDKMEILSVFLSDK